MKLCVSFVNLCVITLLFLSSSAHAQQEYPLKVIPKVELVKTTSNEKFEVQDTIHIYHQKEKSENAIYLKFLLERHFAGKFTIITHSFKSYLEHESPYEPIFFSSPAIVLHRNNKNENAEFYHLEIEQEVIAIEGSPLGLKRGINTLIQLMLTEEGFRNPKSSVSTRSNPYTMKKHEENYADVYTLPTMLMEDKPKFAHRGMLLDCARHFFSVETVKKYLDLMALYKMNVLHWHLTEDQGWRIQIDKYPKLTEVGAWRTEPDGSKYGGFYTKDQIRDIVKYASERGITVIPEIELPGHSQAAVASYPWLSCTGKQVKVVNDWGVFKEIYCAGKDSTFKFLEDVLTEVMDLFPSKYIHIGGDEAPKFRWEHCADCQKRIKDENLKDEHELQSYFIQRIEKFLQKNGRELIGWDEILEGGLSKTATVQSWRGFDGGIKAARQGNQVIMSPTSHCYFDYGLDAIDLKRVFEFDPYPDELEYDNRFNIIGAECNLWSEHIPDEASLDSKVFPRILAMSEALWDYIREDGYEEFYDRVQYHYPLLEKLDVNYGLETIPAKIHSFVKDGEIYATIKSEVPGVTYKIRWDGEDLELDGDYSVYTDMKLDTFLVRDWKLNVKVFKNGKQYGAPVEQFFTKHKAIGAKVKYKQAFSSHYEAAGETALVDGRTGTIEFRDGNWQGFWGKDLDVELDLGKIKEFSAVIMRFNQYQNSWIFRPKKMKIEYSLDGQDWKVLTEKSFGEVKPYNKKQVWIQFGNAPIDTKKARYLRVFVENYGKVPDWHEAAGQDCWLFLDEIQVK